MPCLDDSCDGSHCSVCGGHMADWYTTRKICSDCADLSPEEQEQKAKETQKAYDKAFPVGEKPPWA